MSGVTAKYLLKEINRTEKRELTSGLIKNTSANLMIFEAKYKWQNHKNILCNDGLVTAFSLSGLACYSPRGLTLFRLGQCQWLLQKYFIYRHEYRVGWFSWTISMDHGSIQFPGKDILHQGVYDVYSKCLQWRILHTFWPWAFSFVKFGKIGLLSFLTTEKRFC